MIFFSIMINISNSSYTALIQSKCYTVLVTIPNISNLYTFIGVKAGYISHYVDIVRFNSKKIMNSGHSRI